MKYIMTLIAAASLAACSAEAPHSESGENHTAHQVDKGIVISQARVLPPFPGRDTAAGYMSIKNLGAADKLISVTSPISASVEIHNHLEEDGVMKMRRVDSIELATGETIELKPGSYHLMMFKANLPEDAVDVSLTLNYENAPSVTMIVPIEGRSEENYGSGHDGH